MLCHDCDMLIVSEKGWQMRNTTLVFVSAYMPTVTEMPNWTVTFHAVYEFI